MRQKQFMCVCVRWSVRWSGQSFSEIENKEWNSHHLVRAKCRVKVKPVVNTLGPDQAEATRRRRRRRARDGEREEKRKKRKRERRERRETAQLNWRERERDLGSSAGAGMLRSLQPNFRSSLSVSPSALQFLASPRAEWPPLASSASRVLCWVSVCVCVWPSPWLALALALGLVNFSTPASCSRLTFYLLSHLASCLSLPPFSTLSRVNLQPSFSLFATHNSQLTTCSRLNDQL